MKINIKQYKKTYSCIYALKMRTVFHAFFSVAVLLNSPVQYAFAEKIGIKSFHGTQTIRLGLNKSLVIDLPEDAYDILIANPAVADAVTRSTRRIYLFGKTIGETNIFIFGTNGKQIASLDLVIERDINGLEGHIKRFLPTSQVKVEIINDNIVLRGMVDTPLDSQRVSELVNIFMQKKSTGSTSDVKTEASRILNMIQIIGEDQVMLKVTVAEISRSVMKQLGINWSAQRKGDFSFEQQADHPFGLGKSLSESVISFETPFLKSYLQAMEQAGVMKTLAEPTLTAISGEKATFRVGGEFNIVKPSSSGGGDQSQQSFGIGQIEYGIGLEFRPVVLSAGRISLKIRTSVSEPTSEGSATVGGSSSSAGGALISLRKRLADTTVELPSGGSMMIAGLVRDDVRQVFNKMPGIGDIPVIGALFRSRDFIRNETELVIIVTPYLARSVSRDALRKPDDNFIVSSDIEANFFGKVNHIYGTRKTNMSTEPYNGVVGYIYE